MMEILCPFFTIAKSRDIKCQEEKCALWDETQNSCVFMNLHYLQDALSILKTK